MSTLANSYSSVRPSLTSACCSRPTQMGPNAPALIYGHCVHLLKVIILWILGCHHFSLQASIVRMWRIFALPSIYLSVGRKGRRRAWGDVSYCSWRPPDLLPAGPVSGRVWWVSLGAWDWIAPANSCDPVWSQGAFPEGAMILEYRSQWTGLSNQWYSLWV